MQNRASIITAVTAPTSTAGLKIEISADHVACNDEGNYRCAISGNRASGGKLDSQSTHVHVTLLVQATSIDSIRVYPKMPEDIYNPGTVVNLTCTGDVGKPAADLWWCIKRKGIDISFTGYPNSADISQGSAMLNGCQFRQSSTLTYNVSSNIPEVYFRCETGPLVTCGLPSTLAANFTLNTYTDLFNLPSDKKAFSFFSNVDVPTVLVGAGFGVAGTIVVFTIGCLIKMKVNTVTPL